MAPSRRRNMIGYRRRLDDEDDDEGHVDGLHSHADDDDSVTDSTLATNKQGAARGNASKNIANSSTAPAPTKNAVSNGSAHSPAKANHQPDSKHIAASKTQATASTKVSDVQKQPQQAYSRDTAPAPPKSPTAPVIVSSASAAYPAAPGANVGRRNGADDYGNRRAQDPAHVPNRGAFFMHDSRHGAASPGSALRSFGRGRGRGGRTGFVANTYGRANSVYGSNDPTTNSPWTHDMHDTVSRPHSQRSRHIPEFEGPPNGNGYIPTCKQSTIPINRTLSTEKHIGNAQVRVCLPHMKEAIVFSGIQVKQYTKLPDHRPPLRRDKPVRISLPERAPRYIYPAPDRSFNFIPRALRPNQQQRGRGKSRSAFGSVSGYSRRTSIFGGSYYGSMCSPSVNLSRRSSIVHDGEFMFSPTGSAISRAPLANDCRPVVRLPPAPRMSMMMPDIGAQFGPVMPGQDMAAPELLQGYVRPDVGKMEPPAVSQLVDGQMTAMLPMHQPKPQKNVSLEHIEQPNVVQGTQPYQQAFHQQVPVQLAGSYHGDGHSRRPSYSQQVAATGLSHIPERLAQVVPYNPAGYAQQGYYQTQPQPTQASQGYYYQGGYAGAGLHTAANGYPPTAPSPLAGNYVVQSQMDQAMTQPAAPGSNNLVAQEVNGMVYYFDPSQLQPPVTYQPYATQDPSATPMGNMHGMMTPSPDTLYYPQTASGMVYYTQ